MKLFTRSKKHKGWLVIDESPDQLKYVRSEAAPGVRASIESWTARAGETGRDALEKLGKEKRFKQHRCATLLRPGEYQLLMVDAPDVPKDEVKSAIRWSVKDMLDYPVEQASIDVLDIPSQGGESARRHSMFAVAAKNEVIEARMKQFDEARVPLEVIDIPETAQRNIAALYETEKRATALLFLERQSGLLTINFQGELYLARRMDVGFEQIMKYPPEGRRDILERVQLEVQRTFDHFDRQQGISVEKLLIGPEMEDTGLEAFLRSNLGLTVERVNLADHLRFTGPLGFDARAQWQMFHLVGASLREESRAS